MSFRRQKESRGLESLQWRRLFYTHTRHEAHCESSSFKLSLVLFFFSLINPGTAAALNGRLEDSE